MAPGDHVTTSALAATVQASLDAVVIADEEGRLLEFNAGAEAIFGWRRAEVLTRTIGEVLVPDRLRAAHEAGMARVRMGGPRRLIGRRIDMPARRRDGGEFTCEVAFSEIAIDGRRAFAAIMRDVSEVRAAQAAQADAAAFLQSIFDDQTEVIFRFDADLRVTFFNDAASRFYGREIEQILGRPLFADVHPDVADRLRADLAALSPDAPVTRAIDPKRLRNGELKWIDWTNRALFDDAGELLGYLAVGRDVTDRRAIELALERERMENALYRRMVEALPDFLYAKDLQGCYVTANQAVADARGKATSADLIGRTETEVSSAAFAARLSAEEGVFLASGKETSIETHPAWHPGFEGRWHTTQRVLFRDGEGEITGFIGHVRDVTEQVRAQTALTEAEARFASFLRNAPVGMYLKDEDGRFALANPEMAHVFGRPVEQALGLAARDLFGPARVAQVEAADEEVRRTGRSSAIEERSDELEHYRRRLVVRFPLAAADPSGGTGVGGFVIDVTPIKEAEEEVTRAREALFQSEKLNAVGAFAAGVAHELNNPLAILAGQAAMLAEEAVDGPLAVRAEKIQRMAERCGRIVQSFLAVARRKPPQKAPLDLNEVVEGVLDLAAHLLRGSRVAVDRALVNEPITLVADADQIYHVVLNLVLNAQQAMGDQADPRRLRLATDLDRKAGEARLEVTDTGPGVPREHWERIFEPFFTTKPAGGGTGLGLSFCKAAIEAHGGSIVLLATERGTTFRVTLPAGAC